MTYLQNNVTGMHLWTYNSKITDPKLKQKPWVHFLSRASIFLNSLFSLKTCNVNVYLIGLNFRLQEATCAEQWREQAAATHRLLAICCSATAALYRNTEKICSIVKFVFFLHFSMYLYSFPGNNSRTKKNQFKIQDWPVSVKSLSLNLRF